MRKITGHHDGHGLNEAIEIEADEPDASGASHIFGFWVSCPDGGRGLASTVQFQQGPRNSPSSIAGVTEACLIAVLIDRLEGFQNGPFKCYDNTQTLFHLRAAMRCTKERSNERAKRGVLGRSEP